MIGIYSIRARGRLLNIFVVKRNLFHVINNESVPLYTSKIVTIDIYFLCYRRELRHSYEFLILLRIYKK